MLQSVQSTPTHHRYSTTRRISSEIVNSLGHLTLSYVADVLGHLTLIDILVDDYVFEADGMPDPAYEDLGLFVVVHDPDTNGPLVLVTPKGQVWIARRYPPAQAARDRVLGQTAH